MIVNAIDRFHLSHSSKANLLKELWYWEEIAPYINRISKDFIAYEVHAIKFELNRRLTRVNSIPNNCIILSLR